jgi:hypothetical protein
MAKTESLIADFTWGENTLITLSACSFLNSGFLLPATQDVDAIIRASRVPHAKQKVDYKKKNKKPTPWPWSASDLRLSAKLIPTFADRGCCVVSTTDPYGRVHGFLYRSRYFFFQVAPQLYSRVWEHPFPDTLLIWKSGSAGNRTQDLWIFSQELWPLDHSGARRLSKLEAIIHDDHKQYVSGQAEQINDRHTSVRLLQLFTTHVPKYVFICLYYYVKYIFQLFLPLLHTFS